MEKVNNIFSSLESQVRSYCRKFPVEFSKARNSELFAKDGTRYIDFLDVAGSMNYGHNNPYIKKAIMDYLADDTIINALDLYTEAKAAFLETLEKQIFEPIILEEKKFQKLYPKLVLKFFNFKKNKNPAGKRLQNGVLK